ncbi:MAG: allantoinase AllB [Desulfobacter sp.]
MTDLVVKNGTIVRSGAMLKADVAVQDGKIVAIADSITEPANQTIDAAGKLVFPGAVDCHAHLNDPGYTWREDFEHGSAAAAVGGTTTIIDMPLQNTPALTSAKIFADKEAAIKNRSFVDYAFWGGIFRENIEELNEMDACGCPAFKVFTSPVGPDYQSLSMGLVRQALDAAKKFNGLIGFHCEDFSIIWEEEEKAKAEGRNTWKDFLLSRPVVAELIATRNILDLAKESGSRVHICHVSHPDVARVIKDAQGDGVNVTAETCSHYLTFTEDDVIANGSLFKCAPPLRSAEAREKMWEYVLDGTLSCVGSDHSPARMNEKDGVFEAWGGISGLQSLVEVMFDQGVNKRGFSPCVLASCLAEGPARTFGFYGQKGAVEVGFDADLIVLDPGAAWTITSDSLEYLNKISAFVGLSGKGTVQTTIVRGTVVAQDKKIVGNPGHGNLLKKKTGKE